MGKRQLGVLTAIPVGIAIRAARREPDILMARLSIVAATIARVGRREEQTVGHEKVVESLRNTT